MQIEDFNEKTHVQLITVDTGKKIEIPQYIK